LERNEAKQFSWRLNNLVCRQAQELPCTVFIVLYSSGANVYPNSHLFGKRNHIFFYRVFIFCAPGLVVGGVECVGSHFHVLHAQNHFRRYQGRRFPFSCFALPNSFSAVPRVSDPVFMFCAPGLVFGGIEGVETRFHVLHSRTRFRRYRGCPELKRKFRNRFGDSQI
jgi:hypothetical protein